MAEIYPEYDTFEQNLDDIEFASNYSLEDQELLEDYEDESQGRSEDK